jgi:hypothetical protein
MLLGTAVNVTLSGEVWNSTVELNVPVVLSVTRQFTQGVLLLRLGLETAVRSPVNVRVKLQSVPCAAKGRPANAASKIRSRAFRVVMPLIVRDSGRLGKG